MLSGKTDSYFSFAPIRVIRGQTLGKGAKVELRNWIFRLLRGGFRLLRGGADRGVSLPSRGQPQAPPAGDLRVGSHVVVQKFGKNLRRFTSWLDRALESG